MGGDGGINILLLRGHLRCTVRVSRINAGAILLRTVSHHSVFYFILPSQTHQAIVRGRKDGGMILI